jgi:hypothetical protein
MAAFSGKIPFEANIVLIVPHDWANQHNFALIKISPKTAAAGVVARFIRHSNYVSLQED